jgi:hypothetical protein
MRGRYVGAAVLVAFGVGAGVLAAGSAAAAEPSVDFTGGCALLGVVATSRPDTSTLRMTAGSNVRLVNQLGVDATVMVDGRGMGTVPAEQSTGLTLVAGQTATVRMIPACLLTLPLDADPLTVTVTVTATPPSGPPSAPGGTTPPVPPDSPGPPRSPVRPRPTAGTGTAAAAAPTPRPSPRASPDGGRDTMPGSAPAAAAASRPAPVVPSPTTVGSGPPPQAGPPLTVPVRPLTEDRGFRDSLALIACVLIVGTGLAAIRLLASGARVGTHRGR